MQAIINKTPAKRFTAHSKSWDKMLLEAPTTRQNGYTISDGDVDSGVFAVGAPVFDYTGRVVAGVATAALKLNLTPESRKHMIKLLTNHVQKIPQKLGYLRCEE